MMASSGSTARQSATMRSGRMGDVCISKFGRMYFSHSARQRAISACQASNEGSFLDAAQNFVDNALPAVAKENAAYARREARLANQEGGR